MIFILPGNQFIPLLVFIKRKFFQSLPLVGLIYTLYIWSQFGGSYAEYGRIVHLSRGHFKIQYCLIGCLC